MPEGRVRAAFFFCVFAMKSRIRAFLFHLAGSACLATLAVALVFLVWYPSPLHKAVGVTDIFLLLLGVDVTLGPLMTLVIFDTRKKSLLFDMCVIVALQLAAFSYGLSSVAEGRPAWLVFSGDRFDLVQVTQIDAASTEGAGDYAQAPWWGPRWVAATMPEGAAGGKLLFEILSSGIDVSQRPNRYLPLEKHTPAMLAKAMPVQDLHKFNGHDRVAKALAQWPAADVFLPLNARVMPMTVLLNKASGQVVAVVDLRPWL
jgi:hypothetical protein